MRVKKQKRHRKVVRFYSACFGFREPYKIFCDGTFIHHLIDHSLTPADDTLSHLLGGRVLLFTTSCVVAELRSLGSSHAEALAAAQELVTARCEHEKRVAAPKCIEDVVGEGNEEHFFVATQDADLRKKFREVPGVPLIYGLKNSLFIEQPSKHQREYVASAEEKRLHMSNSEYPRLQKRGQDSSENNMIDLPSEHDDSENVVMKTQATQNTYAARRKLGVADKSKFKRKIAKGPNPLSCKKKKKRETSSSAQKAWIWWCKLACAAVLICSNNNIVLKSVRQMVVYLLALGSPSRLGILYFFTQLYEGEAGSTTKRKRVRKRKRTQQSGKSEASS